MRWRRLLVGLGLSICLLVVGPNWPAPSWAQVREVTPPPSRSRPLDLPSPVSPVLPVPPRRVLPPVPPSPRQTPLVRVQVKQIIVRGSTVFTSDEIAAITRPYVGQFITTEQLEELRLALTQLYLDHGYINSGAILPDQTVANGVIHFQVIEGELTDVIITDNHWFRDSYLRKRLALGGTVPLQLGRLQERLQLLRQDERIRQFQAQLRPGLELGQSELHVRVDEAPLFKFDFKLNNYRAPAVGAEQGQLTLSHRNLSGYGDRLWFTVADATQENARLDVRYVLPLNRYDTTLDLQYRHNRSLVIEAPFDSFNIAGRSDAYTISLRHPVYRTVQREFAVALSGEHQRSRTSSPRPIFASKATITALRFSAEWTERTANQVFAVRSQLSLGIDFLGATVDTVADDPQTPVPTGQFLSWLGQIQWVRRLPPRHIELLFRLDVQLAADPLFSLEQMAIGGRFSVRGYRENQIVRDKGVLVSLETRIPLIRRHRWAEFLQVVPFIDFGWGENQDVFTPEPKVLASLGLGLRWAVRWATAIPLRSRAELFWGYKLIDEDIRNIGGNVQDEGLHFQLVLSSF